MKHCAADMRTEANNINFSFDNTECKDTDSNFCIHL